MTIKTNQQVLENLLNIEVQSRIVRNMVSINSKSKIDMLPIELIEELESFAGRNAIISSGKKNKNSINCCAQCFKAHALTMSKALNLGKEVEKIIHKSIKGKVGHDGYYLDADDLIKSS